MDPNSQPVMTQLWVHDRNDSPVDGPFGDDPDGWEAAKDSANAIGGMVFLYTFTFDDSELLHDARPDGGDA